jgi:hypothetical protein
MTEPDALLLSSDSDVIIQQPPEILYRKYKEKYDGKLVFGGEVCYFKNAITSVWGRGRGGKGRGEKGAFPYPEVQRHFCDSLRGWLSMTLR